MSEIIDYIVIQESTHGSLEISVKNKIKQGWTLQGGVCLSYRSGYSRYIQAMVKTNNNPLGVTTMSWEECGELAERKKEMEERTGPFAEKNAR